MLTTRTIELALWAPLVINLIIIVTFSTPSDSLRISGPSKSRKFSAQPQIWLSEYSQEDSYLVVPAETEFKTLMHFQNDFISKNGTTYVLNNDLNFVVFACDAKYPIKWMVPHMTQVTDMAPYYISSTPMRTSVFPPKVDQPVNKSFRTFLILTIHAGRFLSVSFACTSADSIKGGSSQSQTKTIHLYMNGDKVLYMEGDTISLPIKQPQKSLTIPCRPSHPDIAIKIEKEVHDGNWKEFSPKHMSFDPKLGFTIPWNKGLMGLYKCSVNGSEVGRDEDPYVFVSVVTSGDKGEDASPKYKPHQSHKIKATLQRKENTLQILCCSGVAGGNVSEMQFETCQGHFQCDIMRDFIYVQGQAPGMYYMSSSEANKSCSEASLYESPSLVQCQVGGDAYLTAEFVEVFIPGVTWVANRTALWEEMTFQDEYSKTPLTIFEDIVKVDEGALAQKILISVGHNATVEELEKNGIYLRPVPFSGIDMSKSVLSPYTGKSYHDPERVAEYSRNYYYEGEPLQVICLGVKYFYTEGGYLRLNWRNGSWTLLEEIDRETDVHVYFHGDAIISGSGNNFLSMFSVEIKANLEMESVDCFMPQWGNEKWDKLTYNISTKDSISPKLVIGGGDKEIVYFHLNDTEKEIGWEVAGGAPLPKINVTKDGKQLSPEDYDFKLELDEYNGNGSSNTIKITFKLITYEMQGSYECTAENVKGKDVKIIKVIISDKQSTIIFVVILLICLAVTVAPSVVLLAICFKHKHQIRRLWRLVRS